MNFQLAPLGKKQRILLSPFFSPRRWPPFPGPLLLPPFPPLRFDFREVRIRCSFLFPSCDGLTLFFSSPFLKGGNLRDSPPSFFSFSLPFFCRWVQLHAPPFFFINSTDAFWGHVFFPPRRSVSLPFTRRLPFLGRKRPFPTRQRIKFVLSTLLHSKF